MSPQDFCYWLQGFAELNSEAPTPEQWAAIRDHLQLVFKKETPNRVQGSNDVSLADWLKRASQERKEPPVWQQPHRPYTLEHPEPTFPQITC